MTFASIKIVNVPNVDETPQTTNPNAFKNLDLPPLTNLPDSNLDDVLDPQAPIVIIPLTDSLVYEEEPLLLSCKIVGNPKPKVFKQFDYQINNRSLIKKCCL